MFKREINRRWGLIAAKAWARLLIERIHILVLGFDDKRGVFQRKRPLRTASSSCGRVEEIELSVSVQLAPPITLYLFSVVPSDRLVVQPFYETMELWHV
jgi:hypothetical protein